MFNRCFAVDCLVFFLVMQSLKRKRVRCFTLIVFPIFCDWVLWLFLTVPTVFLEYVIVVFPDHTQLRFYSGEKSF